MPKAVRAIAWLSFGLVLMGAVACGSDAPASQSENTYQPRFMTGATATTLAYPVDGPANGPAGGNLAATRTAEFKVAFPTVTPRPPSTWGGPANGPVGGNLAATRTAEFTGAVPTASPRPSSSQSQDTWQFQGRLAGPTATAQAQMQKDLLELFSQGNMTLEQFYERSIEISATAFPEYWTQEAIEGRLAPSSPFEGKVYSIFEYKNDSFCEIMIKVKSCVTIVIDQREMYAGDSFAAPERMAEIIAPLGGECHQEADITGRVTRATCQPYWSETYSEY